MNDTPRRADTWIAFAMLIFSLFGATWYLSGEISSMKNSLETVVKEHVEMRKDIQDLKDRVDGYRFEK